MAKKIASLTADPRWRTFAERYAMDITRFAIEVCCMDRITWQQVLLFDAVSGFGSRTTVSSGHGTGKTRGFAVIALWHLLCYADSNTYLTAPKLSTLQEGIWKEFSTLKEVIESGPQGWVASFFEIKSKKVYVLGASMRWFITCRTAPRGAPENMAGTHNNYLLWLGDEASGIPEANLKVIAGALTDKRNRFALASQPTRSSGFFYDTHHGWAVDNGGNWTNLVFNSEESPIVSDEFLRDKQLEYGGRDSVEYQIKVQGRFPEHSDKYLIGRRAIEQAIGHRSIKDTDFYGNVLLVDVSAGVYRDKTTCVHVRMVGNGAPEHHDPRRMDAIAIPVYTNSLDWQDCAARVAHTAASLSNCTVVVDAAGMGIQFVKMLERLGVPHIIKVLWGEPNFRKEYRGRFLNQRAQCYVHFKYAIEKQRCGILFQDHHKDLLDQVARLPFDFDDRGRWVMMSKAEMSSKEGLPSPDLADSLAMGFLEKVQYIQADGVGTEVQDSRKASARAEVMEALGLD